MKLVFNKTREQWGWFSNMSAHPITYKGELYHNAECAFICGRMSDEEVIAEIRSHKNPMKAKMISKAFMKKDSSILKHKMLSSEDIRLMVDIVVSKYASNVEIRNKMNALIDGHPKHHMKLNDGKIRIPNIYDDLNFIIEDVTTRTSAKNSSLFWGACEINRGSSEGTSEWVGMNVLGKVWTALFVFLTHSGEQREGIINSCKDGFVPKHINNIIFNFVMESFNYSAVVCKEIKYKLDINKFLKKKDMPTYATFNGVESIHNMLEFIINLYNTKQLFATAIDDIFSSYHDMADWHGDIISIDITNSTSSKNNTLIWGAANILQNSKDTTSYVVGYNLIGHLWSLLLLISKTSNVSITKMCSGGKLKDEYREQIVSMVKYIDGHSQRGLTLKLT